jgi:hypothetical protein
MPYSDAALAEENFSRTVSEGRCEIGDGTEAAVRRVANRRRWQLRMDEHGLAEFRRGGEEVVVAGIVEEDVARSAVDHGAHVARRGP